MNTNKQKQAIVKKYVKEMLKDSYKAAQTKIERALNSGAIDIDSYNPDHNKMILPKCIVIAILESEAAQYSAAGTSFEKQMKKEVKNLRYFI